MSVMDDQAIECPLCMEPLEMDDINFFPCTCGYQICRFCWHRIRTDENGLCPACRKQYPEDPAAFRPLTEDELQRIKKDRRQKDLQRKQKAAENRKHLANVRVVQKNLVFVVGLSQRLAEPEVLRKHDYFGKFGKIHKVVINQNTSYAGSQVGGPSASAYVTYLRPEDALKAIQAVNNVHVDGRTLKASLGTTKYCSHFLRGAQCPKPDCMYLHELGDELASFTKEEMQQGKHQEYEQKLYEQYMNCQNLANQQASQPPSTASTDTSTGSANSVNTTKSRYKASSPIEAPLSSSTPPLSSGSQGKETWPSSSPPLLSSYSSSSSSCSSASSSPPALPTTQNISRTASSCTKNNKPNGKLKNRKTNNRLQGNQLNPCTATEQQHSKTKDAVQENSSTSQQQQHTQAQQPAQTIQGDLPQAHGLPHTSGVSTPSNYPEVSQPLLQSLQASQCTQSPNRPAGVPPTPPGLSQPNTDTLVLTAAHKQNLCVNPVRAHKSPFDMNNSMSLFSSNGFTGFGGSRVIKKPEPQVPEDPTLSTTEIPETIPVESSTDWQAAFGFTSSSSNSLVNSQENDFVRTHADDDLGFDPWDESSKALTDMIEKENGLLPPRLLTETAFTQPSAPPDHRHLPSVHQQLPPRHSHETIGHPLLQNPRQHTAPITHRGSLQHPFLEPRAKPMPPGFSANHVQAAYQGNPLRPSANKMRVHQFPELSRPSPRNTYQEMLRDEAPLPSHSQAEDVFSMKDWQDGLRALLPNINISFGEQQRPQQQHHPLGSSDGGLGTCQHRCDSQQAPPQHLQQQRVTEEPHWMASLQHLTEETSNHKLESVHPQPPVDTPAWAPGVIQPSAAHPPPGFQAHTHHEPHTLTEGLQ